MSNGPTRPPKRPPVRAPPPGYKPAERAANFVLVKIAVGKEESGPLQGSFLGVANNFASVFWLPRITGMTLIPG